MLMPKRTKYRRVHRGRRRGTAKGGTVFAVAKKLELPIRCVGLGEAAEDLQDFSAEAFVDSVLSS